MFKNNLKYIFYITFGIVLYAGLMNLGDVLTFIEEMLSLVYPIVLGLLIAFILNVPMKKIEDKINHYLSKTKSTPSKKTLHGISLLLTLLLIILIIALAITMVVPALISSIKSIYPLIQERLPEIMSKLSETQIDLSFITDWLGELNIEKIAANAGNFFGNALHAATTTVYSLTNLAFSFVIAIYTLLNKSSLERNFKKIIDANFNATIAYRIYYVCRLINETYSKFLSGQCVEAFILGAMICVSFAIFKLPYAILIGFLTMIFAFIPYVGAFASCFIGAVLILLTDPSLVITSIIVYNVVQFIENQFIYPHVVGGSVGLDPLWTLLAALVGGKLFGLAGIILFIPLVAVFYELIRMDTNRKLAQKKLD